MCIVTPVFNGAEYIDDTIYSLLSQAGDFVLRYHVQDGGSRDDTMDRVRAWIKRSKTLPCLCRRIEFTCSSEPDDGMYDAINKGFAHALPPGDDVVMGWIAADDRVAQGACATILNVRNQMPDVRFMGGRVSLLDQSGSINGVNALSPFSRRCMAAGLNDGRAMPFVMQEGTFWCADLWRKVAGLDAGFRLAGDWDLWRRMAAHEAYVSIDSLLGFHRRRPGQLSEHMDKYYREIDAALDRPDRSRVEGLGSGDDKGELTGATLREAYEQIAIEFELIKRDPPRFRVSQHAASAVRYDLTNKLWVRIDGFGVVPNASIHLNPAGVREARSVSLAGGFKAAEGPYPEYGLHSLVRWTDGATATGEVWVDVPGLYRIVVWCRSWTRSQSVVFTVNGQPIGRVLVASSGHDRDLELSVDGTFGVGLQALGLTIQYTSLLVIDWWIEQASVVDRDGLLPVALAPIAVASRASGGGDLAWPRISIVVPTRNHGRFIRDSLNSIIRQSYPNLELIVVDGTSADQTLHELRDFAPHLTHSIVAPECGQCQAVNKGFQRGTGDILTWLNSGDLLAEGALHAIAHAFAQSGADLVAGMCEAFDDGGRSLGRHLPCLNDGPLPLGDLLDLENHWLRGQFFQQPEVFFSRAIWERAGGFVDEALVNAMEYDLWVRMARVGARIEVIGAPVAQFRSDSEQKTVTPDACRPELRAHVAALRDAFDLGTAPIQRAVRQRLKVVMFNDHGFKHGAGIAHGRLATALVALGHEVVALAYFDFDLGTPTHVLSSDEVADAILSEEPDLVFIGNLHSIAADFNLLGSLQRCGIPVIFYAHDEWIATSGYACAGSFSRDLSQCDENCPTAEPDLRLPRDRIASAHRHERSKRADGRAGGFALLTHSLHMRQCLSEASDLTDRCAIHVAPIGIDTLAFDLGDRWRARMLLDLPQEAFIVLTAASNATDARKGFPLLLGALDLIDRKDDVILFVMGFDVPVGRGGIDVRVAGDLSAEDLKVFYYQGADVFVGPGLADEFGQNIIEAACCGVPSIAFAAGGVSDAIVADVTGIVVTERSAPALARAIEDLQTDPVLRRRLGTRARLHALNKHSIEASAARLTRIFATDTRLGVNLAPNVSVKLAGKPVIARYLIEPIVTSDMHPPTAWIPRTNFSEEWQVGDESSLPARFWWATGPQCSFLVRAGRDGAHTLQLSVRNQLEGLSLGVIVNNATVQLIEVTADDPDCRQDLQLSVELFTGLNKIVICLARSQPERGATSGELALLVEHIATWRGVPVAHDASSDGSCELLQGFGFEEQPYPDAGLMTPFRWAIGERCELRIFSAVAGTRCWELAVRNHHPGQRLAIAIDNVPISSFLIDPAPLDLLQRVRFEVDLGIGFHFVTIDATRHTQTHDDSRSLAFIFDRLGLRSSDDDATPPLPSSGTFSANSVAAENAPRWQCVSGFSILEGPIPAFGLHQKFRWAVGSESVIRFSQPMKQVQLLLRNTLVGQVLEFAADDGPILCVAKLEADLALLQEVAIPLPDGGASSLTVRTRVVGKGTPQDERQRSFVLEDVRLFL